MIDTKEFSRRRKRLMDMIGDNSIAILPTAPTRMRNRDVEYKFRPDSDFYYLTGFPEPRATAVIIPSRQNCQYILFCQTRDPKMEKWDGRRAGLEGACELYGADDAYPIEDIDQILPGLLEDHERVFYNMGNDPVFDQKVLNWINKVRQQTRAGVHAPDELIGLNHFLHDMRLYKSRHEIKLMRQAARISSAAHKRAMQHCRPGMTEYQIEAELTYEFLRHGAGAPAYPSIVGGGKNACILHYTENSSVLNKGELLLIDAGAEFNGYASDISRTFPISGEYTPAQRQVYEIVLSAQQAAIDCIRPGNHWDEPHTAAVEIITRGLVELGILKGRINKLISEQAYANYYMHRTGHWLGMDVHDVGDYKVDGEWRMLEAGMVMTVEPGLYLSAGTRGLAKKWWDIGVRIEDDVLVTKEGNDILSKDAPKSTDEIEALMANAA